jgi:hypothetical protein
MFGFSGLVRGAILVEFAETTSFLRLEWYLMRSMRWMNLAYVSRKNLFFPIDEMDVMGYLIIFVTFRSQYRKHDTGTIS